MRFIFKQKSQIFSFYFDLFYPLHETHLCAWGYSSFKENTIISEIFKLRTMFSWQLGCLCWRILHVFYEKERQMCIIQLFVISGRIAAWDIITLEGSGLKGILFPLGKNHFSIFGVINQRRRAIKHSNMILPTWLGRLNFCLHVCIIKRISVSWSCRATVVRKKSLALLAEC